MVKELDLKWFNPKARTTRTSRPRLGIQKRGTYSLNDAGVETLGRPTHIKLAFDEAHQIIAIAPADPEEPGAYPIRKQPNSASYLFSGAAFSNHHGIPLGQPRRYWAEARQGMLIVDLTQEPDHTRWPPRKRDEFGRIPATDGGDEVAE